MSGKLISRYCQRRVHVDDYRLLFGTPALKRALATAAREGRDGTARGETRQSGAKRNARKDAQ